VHSSERVARRLALALLLACAGCDDGCRYCSSDTVTITREVTDELRSALGDDIPDQWSCQNICETGNSVGRVDDAGTSDAGFPSGGFIRWNCEIDGDLVRCVGSSRCE